MPTGTLTGLGHCKQPTRVVALWHAVVLQQPWHAPQCHAAAAAHRWVCERKRGRPISILAAPNHIAAGAAGCVSSAPGAASVRIGAVAGTAGAACVAARFFLHTAAAEFACKAGEQRVAWPPCRGKGPQEGRQGLGGPPAGLALSDLEATGKDGKQI
eukprot:1158392-Pelagomonas_calceolata.AAC.13